MLILVLLRLVQKVVLPQHLRNLLEEYTHTTLILVKSIQVTVIFVMLVHVIII